MPLKRCGDKGWKWGDSGHCYEGKDGKKMAIKQGVAIEGPEKFAKKVHSEQIYLTEDEIKTVSEYMYEKNYSSIGIVATITYLNNTHNEGFTEEINEDNFYIPSKIEYIDAGEDEEEWDIAQEKPGLWENIRKKKQREGKNYKPAKPGDKDRPDPEAWKKAQSEITSGEEGQMAKDQIKKMYDQLTMVIQKIQFMDIKFEEWTADMLSKSELYIQNIFDFVMYYDPTKYGEEENNEDDEYENMVNQASEYQGRKVTLNKPFRTPSGPKKFSVYVKNDKGNVVKVNFGDPNMEIKRDIPARRRSFRARHRCETPGPKWKARYWSCKMW